MKLLLVCCLLLPLVIYAQEKNSIYGKTVQRSNGAPIPNASVFISGTSVGTMSDSAGNFELKGIPAGNFELVISSINYSTVVYPFGTQALPLKLTVQMDPKVVELNEVTVEPFDPAGWQKWGRFFIDNFIGTTIASRRCRIINEKALRFRYNQKKGILTVVADEPLKIVNNHLGYSLQYELEEFTWNRNEHSVLFVGYSFFKDMSDAEDRRQQRFTSRRSEIYNGSMAHFMRSLYYDRLEQEGFEVRKMTRMRNYEKDRVRQVMASLQRNSISSGGKTVMRLGVKPSPDSMNYYQKVVQQPDEIEHVHPYLLKADSLLLNGSDSTRILLFSDFLHITYKNGKEEAGYLKNRMENRRPGNPVSIIFLRANAGISIEPTGYYYPPQLIFSLGYWSWSEKIAHLLPVDFENNAKD